MGSKSSFREALTREYNLTRYFFDNVPDLATGIRAKLIEKTNNPQWAPKDYKQLSSVDEVFGKLKNDQLQFYNDRNFDDYPLNFSLPSIIEVRKVVQENRRSSKQNILDHFVKRYEEKMGVLEHVRAILDQHVVTINNDIKWVSSPAHNKQ